MASDHQITFQPSGIRASADSESTLLQAANSVGEGIESLCGGRGFCGKCKVRLFNSDEQSLKESNGEVTELTDLERRYLSGTEQENGTRLACCARILEGDITVHVPESSRRGRQVIHKGARELPVALDPAVEWYTLRIPKPTLEHPEDDLSRLLRRLKEIYNLECLRFQQDFLERLSEAIDQAKGEVSILIWKQQEMLDARPGVVQKALGVAIDVGTTTVAGYLTDLSTGQILATESMMNPQVPHGEDLMSRLSDIRMRDTGKEEMHQLIIDGLNELICKLCQEAEASPEEVVDAAVVGNTVMHHLVAGLNPRRLAVVPFPPVASQPLDFHARELGLESLSVAKVHLLPNQAGFVGADNTAVLIAEQPHLAEEVILIIDIGTNGEINLGNKERLLSASCACGPAFEGAHIRHGMRAMPGAIEKIRIDPQSFAVEYQIIGCEGWFSEANPGPENIRGLCGSAVLDAIAQMLQAGIIESSGRVTDQEVPGLRTLESSGKEFVIAPEIQTVHGEPITVTSGDVRSIQNAKSAIQAGINLLLNELGTARPDRIILAGAFGMHLDIRSVLRIGMIPAIPENAIHAVGNAAGDGARLALLSLDKRQEARRTARQVEYVELSSLPGFNDEYIMAMMFPESC